MRQTLNKPGGTTLS